MDARHVAQGAEDGISHCSGFRGDEAPVVPEPETTLVTFPSFTALEASLVSSGDASLAAALSPPANLQPWA